MPPRVDFIGAKTILTQGASSQAQAGATLDATVREELKRRKWPCGVIMHTDCGSRAIRESIAPFCSVPKLNCIIVGHRDLRYYR